jgi:hypothetical protein
MIIANSWTLADLKKTLASGLKNIITDCECADIGVFAVEEHELREEVEYWLTSIEKGIKGIREDLEDYYDGEEV